MKQSHREQTGFPRTDSVGMGTKAGAHHEAPTLPGEETCLALCSNLRHRNKTRSSPSVRPAKVPKATSKLREKARSRGPPSSARLSSVSPLSASVSLFRQREQSFTFEVINQKSLHVADWKSGVPPGDDMLL